MKTVIAGLEEGLNAIADALEGGGGGGSSIVPTPAAADEGKVLTANDNGTASWENASGGGIPTPTLNDEGKVLKVIPQTQTKVTPEWASIREVSRGGQNGQVLTAIGDGDYEWETPNELPHLYGEEDKDKVLMAKYDSDSENTYPEWSLIKQVPTGGQNGQVLTKNSGSGYGWKTISQVPATTGVTNNYVLTNRNGTPTWAAAAGGGGGVSVYRAQGAYLKSNFHQVSSGDYSGMYKANVYFFDADGNSLRDLSSVINVSIMVRTRRDDYGFKFKAIDGALAISEYSGDNDFLFISESDYTALDEDTDKVYAAIICVPDVV